MAQSKIGSRYTVCMSIAQQPVDGKAGGITFNDAAIVEFSLDIPLNGLPVGHAKLVGKGDTAANVCSGAYGVITFGGFGPQGTDVLAMPFYIVSATRDNLSADAVQHKVSFYIGDAKMQGNMENMAITGTSVDAVSKIFSVLEIELVDQVTPVKGDRGVTDTMTWRFVEGSMEDYLGKVMDHSNLPGDIMYWAYDDTMGKFTLGSFEISKGSATKNFMTYSSDANMATTEAVYDVKGTDVRMWKYPTYHPSDIAGDMREDRSPNIIIDGIAIDGKKDIGDCRKACWDAIVGSMGSKPVEDNGTFGEQKVVKPFPMNTHRTYAISPLIRRYNMSAYTHKVDTAIYNHPGPPVGSCVYFYAASPQLHNGDFLPDPDYTGCYIITNKTIRKDASTSTGLIGNNRHTETSDMITILEMVSDNGYAGTHNPDYVAVMNVADTVAKAMKKDGK